MPRHCQKVVGTQTKELVVPDRPRLGDVETGTEEESSWRVLRVIPFDSDAEDCAGARFDAHVEDVAQLAARRAAS